MNSRNPSLDVLRGVSTSAFLLVLLGLHVFVGDMVARLTGVVGLALWMLVKPLDDRRIRMFLIAAVSLLATLSVPIVLALFHPPNPLRYDNYLHAIDHGLGLCVPRYLFGFLRSFPWLARLTLGLYQLLPAMMMAGYGWALYSQGSPNLCFFSYLLSSVSAWLYWILPAAGPGFLLGPNLSSPHSAADLSPLQLPFAANCIPSMHLSSAICAWYFSRNHPVGGTISFAYIFITVFSTLALGEHYLIDLVVALPFAVFVISAVKRQYLQAIISFVVLLGWLLGIRLAIHPLVKHNALTWTVAAITASVAILFLVRSEQRTMRWCPTFISDLFRKPESLPRLRFQKTP